MASAFEGATRAAIAELIQTHTQASKFGYVMTHEGFQELVNDLYGLLLNSRSLKAAGDRMLAGGPISIGNKPTVRPKR